MLITGNHGGFYRLDREEGATVLIASDSHAECSPDGEIPERLLKRQDNLVIFHRRDEAVLELVAHAKALVEIWPPRASLSGG